MNDPYAPPVKTGGKDERADREAGTLSLGRLARTQWIFAVAFAVALGSVQAIQFCFGLGKFGGLEHASRVVVLSGVRALGPAESASAALFALVVCTHAVPADALRAQLSRAAPQTLLLVVISAVATIVSTIAAGFLVIFTAFDVPWPAIWSGRAALSIADVPAAIRSLLMDTALASAFCWFALPAMTRRSWTLVPKVGAIFGFHVMMRVVFAFV